MKSEDEIRFFLHTGYFPGNPAGPVFDFGGVDRSRYESWGLRDLTEEGAGAWRQTIQSLFRHGQKHAVPLSGGLDSRAILAALLESTAAVNIETYTFGTPGTYDYNLGCAVARAAGTRHMAIALDAVEWEEGDFTEAAYRFNHQNILFHHVPPRALERFADCMIWSGYGGDLVTGGHCPKEKSKDLKAAKIAFMDKRRAVRSVDLAGCAQEDFVHYIGGGHLSSDFINYDEQVLYAELNNQVGRHVLMKGFQYQTPFINSPFWDFFLSVPDQYRCGHRLYHAMLRREWPDLFSLPTKSHYGLMLGAGYGRVLPRRASHRVKRWLKENARFIDWPALPMTNYTDLDLLLRTNGNLRRIARVQMEDLAARGIVPWIDIDSLWTAHMKRRANYGDALKVLFSLEMNLKGLESEAALGRVVGL